MIFSNKSVYIWGALFLVGAAVGAGIFSLPRVFAGSIPLATLLLLLCVSSVAAVHILFVRALELRSSGNHHHLPGLLSERYGRFAGFIGTLLVVGGLLLAACAQILLSTNIVADLLLFRFEWSLLLVCLLFILPLVLPDKYFVGLERYAALALVVVLAVLAVGAPRSEIVATTGVSWQEILGAILFACSSWTAVPAITHILKKREERTKAIILAGIFVVLLYFFFGFFLSYTAAGYNADFFKAAALWPTIISRIVGVVAFGAIFVSFGHLSRELRATLFRDFNIDKVIASAAIILIPYIAIVSGIRSFLSLAAFAGGVFIAGEYLAILAVSLHVPAPKILKVGALLAGVLFLVAMGSQLEYVF